jgi:transposase
MIVSSVLDRARPSIPPERLLRALLLQVLYSIRSERMLMEQLDYNLLFRWFVGLSMAEPPDMPATRLASGCESEWRIPQLVPERVASSST